VLLLCQHFHPELISTGLHMTELAGELASRGWGVHVIAAQPSLRIGGAVESDSSHPPPPGVTVERVSALGSHRRGVLSRGLFAVTFALGALFRAVLRRDQYDGILLTTNPPLLGIAGLMAKWLAHRPYVLIVYDVYPDVAIQLGVLRKRSFVARGWHWLNALAMRSAERIVVIGRDMEQIIRARVSAATASRIVLIPNWSDARTVFAVPRSDNAFARARDAGDRLVVQYSGRLGATHNLEPLLQAAALLAEKPIFFEVIGDGAKRAALREESARLGLRNIRFLDYQPVERLAEVLSSCDLSVVCLDPRFTGLSVPSKAYGVMAAGVPVLALLEPRSEIGLMVAESGAGIVVHPPTAARVAAVLLEVLEDRPTAAAMGVRARAAFLQRYTLESAGREYARCLGSAFGREPSRP
jgi:glycosyltransferase involved in cell wall biosynthesis